MSKDSWLVVRADISYLRLLGEEPSWKLMTATASEDNGSVQVCADRRRLVEAAIKLCKARGLSARETMDLCDRDYVGICRIVRERGEDVDPELIQIVEEFFDVFDSLGEGGTGGADDLVDLYGVISSEGTEDVYLSDGVWLSSDGSLHDRGR